MNVKLLNKVSAVSLLIFATGCATTDTPSTSDTSFTNTIEQSGTCNYGNDFKTLEAIKDSLAAAPDRDVAALELKPEIESFIGKTDSIAGSSRPEDALGCRFLEMEARVLLVDVITDEGEGNTYTAAKDSIDDVKTLCTTTNDARMCSVARLHDSTIFSRRAAGVLDMIARQDNSVQIDWDTTRSLTQSMKSHVATQWPVYLAKDASEGDITSSAIERSLFASACEIDKAVTQINRRVGLSINRDANGKLVPYGKDSGELLAQMAVAMNLSPNDSCYNTPEERVCRGSLASKMHLACLRAGGNTNS
ncbi:hypothetical protein [Hirschia litorea]|uniref:Lipoprotein n=1 Tax=Hirschia litorea TaxID=1199156 RepID=A0ABW2II60_9PROT